MAIRINNGAQSETCQSELATLLGRWKEAGCTADGRTALDEKYQECSKFSKNCPVCLRGRQEFMTALDSLKAGNLTEARAKISKSFTTVRYKWSKFFS